jgi:hypothetical protein
VNSNSDGEPPTTTNDKIALRELLEKGSAAGFLREMIGFAAQRLMELETEELCGAGLADSGLAGAGAKGGAAGARAAGSGSACW